MFRSIAPLGTTVWRPCNLYRQVYYISLFNTLTFPVPLESKRLSKRRIIYWVNATIGQLASINPLLRSSPLRHPNLTFSSRIHPRGPNAVGSIQLRRLMDSTPISKSRCASSNTKKGSDTSIPLPITATNTIGEKLQYRKTLYVYMPI